MSEFNEFDQGQKPVFDPAAASKPLEKATAEHEEGQHNMYALSKDLHREIIETSEENYDLEGETNVATQRKTSLEPQIIASETARNDTIAGNHASETLARNLAAVNRNRDSDLDIVSLSSVQSSRIVGNNIMSDLRSQDPGGLLHLRGGQSSTAGDGGTTSQELGQDSQQTLHSDTRERHGTLSNEDDEEGKEINDTILPSGHVARPPRPVLQRSPYPNGAKVQRELSSLSVRTRGESASSSDLTPVDHTRLRIMRDCEALDPFADQVLGRATLLQKMVKLVQLLKSDDVIDNLEELHLDYALIIRKIRPLVATDDTLVRTSGFRLLRHLMLEQESIGEFNSLRVHLFVVRTLDVEHRHVLERMEALKLCRRIMELKCSLLPRGIVRSLVAIANNPEDTFRRVALETLRQMALRCTAMVAQCDGIRVIVQAIVDPEMREMAQSLTLTLLHLLSHGPSRQYIRPSLDVAALLSPLTNADSAGKKDCRASWKACQAAIILFMKTWTGMQLMISDPHGIRSLCEILVQPVSLELREMVLETISLIILHLCPYDITVSKADPSLRKLNEIEVSAEPQRVSYWGLGPNAQSARELTMFGVSSEYFPRFQTEPHAVMNQFLAIALMGITARGLVDALVEIVAKENPPFSRTAAQLLGILSRLSERLLPESRHWKLFNMADLVAKATQSMESTEGGVGLKLEPRRAGRMIALLARIVGISYESTVATIRSRYTYSDAVSLCAELELAMAPVGERERQNVGIFPRGEVASLPYEPRLMTSLVLEHALGERAASVRSTSILPGKAGNSMRGSQSSGEGRRSSLRRSMLRPVSLISKSKRQEQKVMRSPDQQHMLMSSMATQLLDSQEEGSGTISGRALLRNLRKGAVPDTPSFALSNRGHRRDVRTALLTEDAYSDTDHLNALLYQSKVLQGKDWRVWEWSMVDQIVTGALRHHGLCHEVLKTKFVKRVFGFFRAMNGSEYLVLPWRAQFLPYTSVCVSLVHAMLDFQEGVDFLRHDRRGRLHRQIVEALVRESQFDDDNFFNAPNILLSGYFSVAGEATGAGPKASVALTHARRSEVNLLSSPTRKSESRSSRRRSSARPDRTDLYSISGSISGASAMGMNGAGAGSGNPNVSGTENGRIFSPIACSRTMTRGLFAILGAYTSHSSGIQLLEEQNLFRLLSDLSLDPQKDYILRLAVLNFDFAMSVACRDWLQSLVLSQSISVELTMFVVGFIRSLLRRSHVQQNEGFARWLLEILMSLTGSYKRVAYAAVSVLNEAVYYPSYLREIGDMSLEPLHQFQDMHSMRPFMFKIASTSSGLQRLKETGWLDRVVVEWKTTQCLKYAARLETLMTLKMLCRDEPLSAIPRCYNDYNPSDADADSVDQVYESTFGIEAATKIAARQLNTTPVRFHPIHIRVHTYEATAEAEPGFVASDVLSLLRLPWTVEVWARMQNGKLKYVPTETALDCSLLSGPEFGVDEPEIVAKELSDDGMPSLLHGLSISAIPSLDEGFDVPEGTTLYACLTLGGDPVRRNGIVNPVPEGGGDFQVPMSDRVRRASSAALYANSSVNMVDNASLTYNYANSRDHADIVYHLDFPLTTRETHDNLDDEVTWIKCGPEHLRLWSVDEDMADQDSFTVCPGAGCPATFSFQKSSFAADGSTSTLSSVGSGRGPTRLRKISFYLTSRPDCPNAPYIPSHMFGEVARTSAGANYLRSRGCLNVQDMVDKLQDDSQPKLHQRATLWSVSHIASSEAGLHALEEESHTLRDRDGSPTDLLRVICNLAARSDCLALRGTAITTMGLFAHTARGRQLLKLHGWETSRKEDGSFGYNVVPKTFSTFFHPLESGTPYPRAWDGLSLKFLDPKAAHRLDNIPGVAEEDARTFLEAVSNMMNHIAHRDAHRVINKFCAKHPEVISSPTLFLLMHDYLGNFRYEQWVRSFLQRKFQQQVAFDTPAAWKELDAPEQPPTASS